MDKVVPLQNQFLKFHFEEVLGRQNQSQFAYIIGSAERTVSVWFTKSDPQDRTLKRIAKAMRRHLGQPVEGDEAAGEDLVDAFSFIRDVQTRSASLDDVIPEQSVRFLRIKRLIDADGEPTEKLIKWLTSTPAPLVAPRYISKEQAFNESKATSAIWLNPHNHYSLPLVGRDTELALLDQFINSKERFKIAALVAPSGAGKTRLVSYWAKPYIVGEKSEEWDAGFVDSPNADPWSEQNWQPTKNTLIIIDYTYNYADVIGAIMKRFVDGAPYDIRLLVLDHVLPEKLQQDIAFKKGVPSLGFREAKSELFFETWPIALNPISDPQGFLREIIAAAADPYKEEAEARRFKPESPEVITAAEALMKIEAVDEASATPDQIKRRDAVRHPLFAALLGQMIRQGPKSDFSGMTRRDLVGHYFENERRLPWSDEAQDPTLGYWVGLYVSAATLLRGVAINDILEFQDDPPETTEPVLEGSDFKKLHDVCGRFVSSEDQQVIKPFEPDILGETFLLKFLFDRNTAMDYRAIAAMLNIGCESDRFQVPAGSFLATIQRLVRNLINDDQSVEEVKGAWRSLDRFLDPKWYPMKGQLRQAVSIARGDLITQLRSSNLINVLPISTAKIELGDLLRACDGDFRDSAFKASLQSLDLKLEDGDISDEDREVYSNILQKHQAAHPNDRHPIHFAAREGCVNVAAAFARVNKDCINCTDATGNTVLLNTVRAEKTEFLQWLLSNGVDPNGAGRSDSMTPLMEAVQAGNISILDELIKAGAQNDLYFNKAGMTALMMASSIGHIEIVKRLIAGRVDIALPSPENGFTALMYACLGERFPVVSLLLECQQDINQGAPGYGLTPLIIACMTGNAGLVEFLLQKGADPNLATTDTDYTPLMQACERGSLGAVEALLNYNLDLDAGMQPDGWTALMFACQDGQYVIAERLLDAGASIKQTTRDGRWDAKKVAISNGFPNISVLIDIVEAERSA